MIAGQCSVYQSKLLLNMPTIIEYHVPTEQLVMDDKNHFYSNPQEEKDKILHSWDTKVGIENKGCESCMGQEGVTERNDNGQK
jgi:hypothetical protein